MTDATQPFLRKSTEPPAYVVSDDILQKGFDPYVTKRYLEFLKPYSWRLFWSILLMIVASLAVVAGPLLVQIALDDGLAKNDSQVLLNAVLLYALAAASGCRRSSGYTS